MCLISSQEWPGYEYLRFYGIVDVSAATSTKKWNESSIWVNQGWVVIGHHSKTISGCWAFTNLRSRILYINQTPALCSYHWFLVPIITKLTLKNFECTATHSQFHCTSPHAFLYANRMQMCSLSFTKDTLNSWWMHCFGTLPHDQNTRSSGDIIAQSSILVPHSSWPAPVSVSLLKHTQINIQFA